MDGLLAQAESLTQTAQQEVTATIHALRPAALHEVGLVEALRAYVTEWSQHHEIVAQVDCQGQHELPLVVEQGLFRVAQEALANVARHSQATQVTIQIIAEQHTVTLSITDNGRGFHPQTAAQHGIGLQSMRERVASSGGTLTIESRPGEGRTVPFVSKATAVPLAKAAARIAVRATIAELRREGMLPRHGDGGELPADAPIAVKEAVLPFHRFRSPAGDQVDSILGPEMKSTGEVMGFDRTFGSAFAKSQAASAGMVPTKGTVFVTSPTATSGPPSSRSGACTTWGSGSWPRRGRRRCCGATGSRPRSSASTPKAPATSSSGSSPATSTS